MIDLYTADLVPEPSREPKLVVDDKSPKLALPAKTKLLKQWKEFWKLRLMTAGQNLHKPNSDDLEPVLKDEALVHNLDVGESLDRLAHILGSGIMSGELGYPGKPMISEQSETHFCADFFVNQEPKSVADFMSFIKGKEDSLLPIRRLRIEVYNSPAEDNSAISLVVDSSNPHISGLLELSATGLQSQSLDQFPIRFPYSDERPEIASRHRAVLVGIPANFISFIIVGGELSKSPQKVQQIKNMIKRFNLDIALFDYSGERL